MIEREREKDRERREWGRNEGEGRAVCRHKGGIAEREGWRR